MNFEHKNRAVTRQRFSSSLYDEQFVTLDINFHQVRSEAERTAEIVDGRDRNCSPVLREEVFIEIKGGHGMCSANSHFQNTRRLSQSHLQWSDGGCFIEF